MFLTPAGASGIPPSPEGLEITYAVTPRDIRRLWTYTMWRRGGRGWFLVGFCLVCSVLLPIGAYYLPNPGVPPETSALATALFLPVFLVVVSLACYRFGQWRTVKVCQIAGILGEQTVRISPAGTS